ncbi:MAG: glycosyltransferase [Pirellulales bacterium]
MPNDSSSPQTIDCSILLPRAQLSDCLADVAARLVAASADAGIAAELLCIDTGAGGDGSHSSIPASLAPKAVRWLRFDTPVGLGAAWKAGIAAARGEFVVAWEASRCYAAEDLPRLVSRLSRADLIVGRRRRSWLARQARRAALVPRWLLVGGDVLDPRSPVWAARREAVVGLPLELGLEGWIASLVARRGYRVCELNIAYDSNQPAPAAEHPYAPHLSEMIAAWHICRQPQAIEARECATAATAAIDHPTSSARAGTATDESAAHDSAASLPGPWLAGGHQSQPRRDERAA